MTVARYIGRLLAIRLLFALLTLAALLQLFDLFNNARELLSRGGNPSDLATYAALRFPSAVEHALPIAMLVGALATFVTLTRSSEMIALRTAGITVYRVLSVGIPVAALSGVLHYTLLDLVTPWSESRFHEWWDSFDAQQPSTEDEAVWLRSGDMIVRVRGVADAGHGLREIRIVWLSDSGTVVSWLDADTARRTPAGWMLQGVQYTRFDHGRAVVTLEDDRAWPGTLDPGSIVQLSSSHRSISTARMREILQGTWAGENSPSYYQTRLHHNFAFPLASLVMLLLAAPAAYTLHRRGGTGRGLALGFGLGMTYLLTDGLLSAFGEARVLPPVVAAWTAPVLFGLIGGSVLVHYEE
jgi:lipopolysaccharide export system permease protein